MIPFTVPRSGVGTIPGARRAIPGARRAIGGVLVGLTAAGTPTAAWAQHGHGDPHPTAEGARLEVEELAGENAFLVRVGPVSLPAGSSHHDVAQAPDQLLEIPFDGWLTAYRPRLADAEGHELPGRLLHHVAFWNTDRSDFLCPNKEEHIFGAGGEMNEWIPVPGFGYRVAPGDRIRVSTMFHNPTARDYPEVYLEVRVERARAGEGEPLRGVYPTWFDVRACGESDYDLPPGRSVTRGELEIPVAGRLLGVGGHMHDYGVELTLERLTPGHPIATLTPETDDHGRIVSMPIVPFFLEGGRPLRAGERLLATATYVNPGADTLPEGAMGIVVGYFLPDDDAGMKRFRRAR